MTQIASRYRFVRPIGSSVAGEVYEAEDTQLRRNVAVRIIPRSALDPETIRIAARLEHPCFCAIYEILEEPERTLVAMALARGETLEQKLSRTPLPLNQSFEIALQIGGALLEAGAHGLPIYVEACNVAIEEPAAGRSVPARFIGFPFLRSCGAAMDASGEARQLSSLFLRMLGDPEARGCPPELAGLLRRSMQQIEPLPSVQDLVQALESCRGTGADPMGNTQSMPAAAANQAAPGTPYPWEESTPRYGDLGIIGRGGMGEVRRVRDRFLNRTLAMKTLRVDRPQAIGRFIEEAQVTAQLQHPAIIPVHDIGTLPDGRLYYTMQEVHGKTFEQVISEAHRRPGQPKWSLRQLVSILQRACEGVGYAHQHGVLHRDLKPSNVMVGDFGEVMVLDWGLTRILAAATPVDASPAEIEQTTELELTRAGTVIGTPRYMSPEQASGDVASIGTHSDVYALGAVLYKLLDGRAPYSGSKTPVTAVCMGPPRELSERPSRNPGVWTIPAELKSICQRAMAHDPRERYANATELAHELADWLEGAQRRERAARILADASDLNASVAGARAESEQLLAQAGEMLATIPPFAPVENKRPVWEVEDRAQRLRDEAEVGDIRFTQLVRGALTHAPDFPPAHAMLAGHYRELHARAEAARDSIAAAQFEVLLREHDDGRFAAYLRGVGALTLSTNPPGAHALLFRYVERDRRLEPEFLADLGSTPVIEHPLEMGSYLVRLTHPERIEVNYPVFIERQLHWDGVRPGSGVPDPVYLPSPDELRPDECYVPAGWFWSGGDPLAKNSLPARRLWLDGFVMPRFPVTVGDYIEFLNDLRAQGREVEAAEHVPPLPAWEEGRTAAAEREVGVVLSTSGRYHLDGPDEKLRWPVTMLNWASSHAYAEWRAAHDRLLWRMVTEMEHEKAMRGVDTRVYPWGHHLDPTFCAMRMSHAARGRVLKALVDEYPGDESPYGIRGLAGNTHVWCEDAASLTGPVVVNGIPHPPDPATLRGPGAGGIHRVVRGGSWRDNADMCRAAFRDVPPAVYRDTVLGIRVVRSLR